MYYLLIFVYHFIANVQNICNRIGQKDCNIGDITLLVSVLYSDEKGQQHLGQGIQERTK